MTEIKIDLTDDVIRQELETRLGKIRRDFEAAFNCGTTVSFTAGLARAEYLAERLAKPQGIDVAIGILEHIVPKHEAQGRDFWLTALGRAVAYLSGATAPYSIDRRMVLEQVTGITRQGTYKIQAEMRADKHGDICAEDLRRYLQKRMTRVDGAS